MRMDDNYDKNPSHDDFAQAAFADIDFATEFDEQLRATAQQMRPQMQPSAEVLEKTLLAAQQQESPAAQQQESLAAQQQERLAAQQQESSDSQPQDNIMILTLPAAQRQAPKPRRLRRWPIAAAAAATVLVAMLGMMAVFRLVIAPDISQMAAYSDSSSFDVGAAAPEVYAAGANNFAPTSTQEAGIVEADIVETDGPNIYALYGDELIISAVNGSDTIELSRIKLEYGYARDIHVAGNRLLILFELWSYGSYSGFISCVGIYDISDLTNPQLLEIIGQDGDLIDTRLVDDKLYMVSVYTVANTMIGDDPSSFVPHNYQGLAASRDQFLQTATLLAAEYFQIMPAFAGAQYTLVSAIDINRLARSSEIALLGDTATIYLNGEDLFLTAPVYNILYEEPIQSTEQRHLVRVPFWPWEILSYIFDRDSWYTPAVYSIDQAPTGPDLPAPATMITRIALNGGQLDVLATTSIDGALLNQFSLDEYQGYLRLAVTTLSEDPLALTLGSTGQLWPAELATSTRLLILDGDLELVGSTDAFATGRRIDSVSFQGEVAYMFGSEQSSSLFVIDLSDPSHPRVADELEANGLS